MSLPSGATELHFAAQSGDLDAIERLVAAGADVNARDEHGNTPLKYASAEPYPSAVRLLLARGADVNLADDCGFAPLHCATGHGFSPEAVEITQLLLEAGADVNARSMQFGFVPLHDARGPTAIELLLANGADPMVRDEQGLTPLEYMLADGRPDDAKHLRRQAHEQGRMTADAPVCILFAGSGEFGVPTLRAIMAAGHQVPLVVTQPDKPAGRGAKLTPTPVAVAAEALGLPVLKTASINKESLPAADLLVVIAFGQKIGPAVVAAPRLGAVNLHASRLPRYRGAAPINWAILAGETVAGNSVIRLADKMDAGAVLAMSAVPIGELETAGELHDRLSEDGVGLVLKVIADLAAGRAVETEQDHAAATLAPKLSRESAKLDFARPAAEVARQIRGLSPWPGCRVQVLGLDGKPADSLRLVRARAVPPAGHPAAAAPPPGTILPDGTVAAGDGGSVDLVEVQPDGKRPMKLGDYRRGHAWTAGMRLVGT